MLIRSNGELTYFATDTAYYVDKRGRGFDMCIYLLGADHHGYVGRLKAMAACAGDDPEHNIEVLIGQLVKIVQDGEELRLSKRAGTLVTLQELVDVIGVDALRYSLARYPPDSPLTLDVEEITRARPTTTPSSTSSTSHARTAHRSCATPRTSGCAPGRLRPDAARPREGGRAAAGAGRVPAGGGRGGRRCASRTGSRATSRTTAATFHRFYDDCRVLPHGRRGARPTCTARGCCWSRRRATVFENGLDLLGVARTGADVSDR